VIRPPIKVWIKPGVTNAFITITNLQGETLTTIPAEGQGDVEVNVDSLPSGSYFYTLFINGKKVDTKKMVVLE
jgi:hypothetical protein